MPHSFARCEQSSTRRLFYAARAQPRPFQLHRGPPASRSRGRRHAYRLRRSPLLLFAASHASSAVQQRSARTKTAPIMRRRQQRRNSYHSRQAMSKFFVLSRTKHDRRNDGPDRNRRKQRAVDVDEKQCQGARRSMRGAPLQGKAHAPPAEMGPVTGQNPRGRGEAGHPHLRVPGAYIDVLAVTRYRHVAPQAVAVRAHFAAARIRRARYPSWPDPYSSSASPPQLDEAAHRRASYAGWKAHSASPVVAPRPAAATPGQAPPARAGAAPLARKRARSNPSRQGGPSLPPPHAARRKNAHPANGARRRHARSRFSRVDVIALGAVATRRMHAPPRLLATKIPTTRGCRNG